jgi:hypothetical protein
MNFHSNCFWAPQKIAQLETAGQDQARRCNASRVASLMQSKIFRVALVSIQFITLSSITSPSFAATTFDAWQNNIRNVIKLQNATPSTTFGIWVSTKANPTWIGDYVPATGGWEITTDAAGNVQKNFLKGLWDIGDSLVLASQKDYTPINPGPILKYGPTKVQDRTTVAGAPAPLPLLGAAAGYSWARKLRRRLREKNA